MYTSEHVPTSAQRFDDGAAWRVEIPSVEGPDALIAVLDEARIREVPIHRVSQGSGMTLMLDSEIEAMVELGTAHDVEVTLFLGPRAGFDIGRSVSTPDGAGLFSALRGNRQLHQALDEVDRAVSLGARSFLVGDLGALAELGRRRSDGRLPRDVRLKVSAMAAPANPAAAAVMSELGADSINVHSDHTLEEFAEFRAAVPSVLDVYVEAPDSLGGFVRYLEIPELVRVAAPVHLKFGLRNAAAVYPAGGHLADVVQSAVREKVRRAQIGLEHLRRAEPATAAADQLTPSP
jgi:hypothetical protein